MGQQLNLEFKQNDVVIGNAFYYHGGYTDDAIQIAKEALTKLTAIEGAKFSPRLRAFYAMHATGARMTEEDYRLLLFDLHTTDEERRAYADQYHQYTKPANRGDGLIGFSPKSIEQTAFHAVNTITVDLDTLKINFDCMYFEEDVEDLKDSYDLYDDEIEEIPLHDKPLNLSEMGLADISDFEKALELAKTNDNLIFKTSENEYHIMIG